jgi:RNA polymerase sigma-54 factor
VCRVVNNKYVQTEFGIFELRFFFSESLTNDEGDEVSTRIIKEKIKDIIGKESKNKPWSDDKLAKELKKEGYNVARRTVAKYREQLKIPVARLRKEL